MKMNYSTLIVTFRVTIKELNGIFDTPETWGVSTLKEWIDNYESTRFTQIGDNMAVITSEYNMPLISEWLQKYTPITEQRGERWSKFNNNDNKNSHEQH